MKLYSIGQASAMIDVPIRTIRYYESIGLCSPSVTDESSGYRYYSIDDIFRLDLIRCLGRQLGMPLKTIEDYLKESGSPETLEKYLIEQEKDIDSQIAALQLRKDFLSARLEALHKRRETPPLTPRLVHRERRDIFGGSAEIGILKSGEKWNFGMCPPFMPARPHPLWSVSASPPSRGRPSASSAVPAPAKRPW